MNPFDPSLFTNTSPCIPCCPAPTDCSCALLIPPLTTIYADYSTALAVVDGSNTAETVNGCIGYAKSDDLGGTLSAFTATFDGTTLSMDGSSSDSIGIEMWASISLLSGAVVSVAYTKGESGEIDATLYSCDGTLIETKTDGESAAGTLVFSAVSSDGEYFLKIASVSGPLPPSASITSATTVSSTYWVNPVIALWDDSGTTRKLWACPKLLLPPLTESTGDWYASCADADAVLTSTQVSNCVGYTEGGPNLSVFTATDGGTSLTLAEVLVLPASFDSTSYGGINAVGGQTLTFTATVGAGTAGLNVSIFDDTGTLVEASGATSSPWTSSALPYTGRYTLQVLVTTSSTATVFSCVVTSSGTMSVNPIQARWDLGLTCAGTLDCGDACP